jgi:hypothetical protein
LAPIYCIYYAFQIYRKYILLVIKQIVCSSAHTSTFRVLNILSSRKSAWTKLCIIICTGCQDLLRIFLTHLTLLTLFFLWVGNVSLSYDKNISVAPFSISSWRYFGIPPQTGEAHIRVVAVFVVYQLTIQPPS